MSQRPVRVSAQQQSASAMLQTLRQAVQRYNAGDWPQAEQLCHSILHTHPEQFDALNILGSLAVQTHRLEEAQQWFGRAVRQKPHDAPIQIKHGNVLLELNRLDEALLSFERALRIQPQQAEAHYNRGVTLQALKRSAEALQSYDEALRWRPDYVLALSNRGAVLFELERYDDALESYERALLLAPDAADLHYNRAFMLQQLRRFDAALASYERALALNPEFANAHNNRGVTLLEMGRFDQALCSFELALRTHPNAGEVYSNSALALQQAGRDDAALACYERAFQLSPDFRWLAGSSLHARMRACEWQGLEFRLADLRARIERGADATPAFPVLALIDSARLQRQVAHRSALATLSVGAPLPAIARRSRQPKLRIGYYSADFHDHATTYLAAELFERHDRERFEIVAFSFGPQRQDPMRRRVAAALGQFVDVQQRSDREIAQLSRAMQIDIAVDLKGFTEGQRARLFAYRAAPIQVNYLGYPATMGVPYMDYIVADATLIPAETREHYAEKVIYLPHSYQVNDRERPIAERRFSRAELGLPADGFVFCSFNSAYKIVPATFDGWLNILRQVEHSVLWLLQGSERSSDNLRTYAQARGVSGERLVFAPRLPLPEHLARHFSADLFLDTLPCNAHTTASDALWAQLPVLTCIGEAFAGRVAASLLNAVGLPELVTRSQTQFEQVAVELARDPARLRALRARLQANRLCAPLFDSALYARHLEHAYTQAYERYQSGLAPEHLFIAP